MIDRAAEHTLTLTLPDGSQRSVPAGTLPSEVVRSIGERLLQAAVAVQVDGEIQDLNTPLRKSGSFRVLTEKDADALAVLRHSAAHVLATAVRRVRPDAKIGFGPAIDDGFYYDFEVKEPFTPDDLAAFEKEMQRVSQEKFPFERREVSRAEAQKVFADDPLKLERLSELGDDEVISIYTDGPFIDLCRGPHVPDTGRVKHYRLTHTAGAYWRGDSRRQMLQRIYGTAWFKKDDLDQYLHRQEEAKRRDHRVVGKALDLFMMHPVSPGAVFWTERGTILFNELNQFIRERQQKHFHEIKTPLLYNKALWEQSGHWGKYKENMFLVLDSESGEHDFSLKPMNCPSHYLLYNSKKHSYRELPLRYVTFDVLHRNEVTGALSGLVRVRQFQQDDCHVFLRQDQIAQEVSFLMNFILDYYAAFGLEARVKFATRPETRIGSDALWDAAKAALKGALEATGKAYELKPGDGAFYGPKIDFDVLDSIGRPWQLGTIQLDYMNPERFEMSYVGEDNTAHRPVVIHRAVSGSLERFIAILIEHFAGSFPVWLSPEQVRVLPIAEDYAAYGQKVAGALEAAGVRVHLDARSETLKYRIAEGARMKVPYMLVVGAKEMDQGTVAVNVRGAGREQKPKPIPLEQFVAELSKRRRRDHWSCMRPTSVAAALGIIGALGFASPSLAQVEHPISARIDMGPAGISTRPGSKFEVKLAVNIPAEPVVWHLYSITQPPGGPIATTITVGPSSKFRLGGTIQGSSPDVADDPNFGMVTETHRDSVTYRIPIIASPSATGTQRLAIALRYQTCNDRYCLPPVTDTIAADIKLSGAATATSAAFDSLKSSPESRVSSPASQVPSPESRVPSPGSQVPSPGSQVPSPGAPLPGNGSLALFLWIAATMGALSLLTPCVFPMVPITISYFSRDTTRSRAGAFRDAGVYALGIMVAFTAIGLGLAIVLGATGLNRFAANPWLNLAIAVLFAGFALSLFGIVNLGVPGSFVNRIDELTRTTKLGHHGTTLLMGGTFALTTFTCTAPFVGTLLVAATQGDWLWPALGLLTFSGVFALPFVILAMVPGALKTLPRSGEWMVTLKGTLAFLELAAAMKFLSNADLVQGWGVFTRNVVIATWVALGIALIVYLLKGKRHWVPAVVTAVIIAWLATGLTGRRLGELEPFLPPAPGGVANASELSWMLDDYAGALARAKSENKLVLIDFTGYTCTNCRWMEANMFPREEVEREMEKFVRVRLFTDGADESNARHQKLEADKFNTVALPLYAVVDGDGNTRGQFLGMTRKSDEFIAFLTGASRSSQ